MTIKLMLLTHGVYTSQKPWWKIYGGNNNRIMRRYRPKCAPTLFKLNFLTYDVIIAQVSCSLFVYMYILYISQEKIKITYLHFYLTPAPHNIHNHRHRARKAHDKHLRRHTPIFFGLTLWWENFLYLYETSEKWHGFTSNLCFNGWKMVQ